MKKIVKKSPRSKQAGPKKKETHKVASKAVGKAKATDKAKAASEVVSKPAIREELKPQVSDKKAARKKLFIRLLCICGSIGLITTLILVIWQPVLPPSSTIIKVIAGSIKIDKVQMDLPVVMSFNLDGKGGGVYSIVATKDGAKFVEGMTEQADLIIFMEAKEFNYMMAMAALGKVYVMTNLFLSNSLRYAGDMNVLTNLTKK